ncbi:deaminase [Paraburkholderia xenovorans]
MREALAERSATDDPKAKIVPQSAVGSVIADREGEIARSANVLPPIFRDLFDTGVRQVSDVDRYHFIEHAERAAIFKALRSRTQLSNATIYCTRFPCSDCARAILFSGIKRAVFLGGFAGEKRWLPSQRAALRILRDGGVVVRYLRLDEEPQIK